MTVEKKTLGQAIDDIIAALSALDEKARQTAIAAACSHLGLDQPIVQATAAAATHTPPSAAPAAAPARPVDIRSLKDAKQPENAKEMACLVAYYLQQFAPTAERKDVVTRDDMVKYFKQAHFPLPKQIGQLLIDARHSGYFDVAERGSYRLNAVGYNLVAHALPRHQTTRK
jgi:hypothetical protein